MVNCFVSGLVFCIGFSGCIGFYCFVLVSVFCIVCSVFVLFAVFCVGCWVCCQRSWVVLMILHHSAISGGVKNKHTSFTCEIITIHSYAEIWILATWKYGSCFACTHEDLPLFEIFTHPTPHFHRAVLTCSKSLVQHDQCNFGQLRATHAMQVCNSCKKMQQSNKQCSTNFEKMYIGWKGLRKCIQAYMYTNVDN